MKFPLRVCGVLWLIGLSPAHVSPLLARPGYSQVFQATYTSEFAGNEAATQCTVCHFGPAKRSRNDYGMAMTKALKARNVRDPEAVREALKQAAKQPSASKGKTFGDLIKSGQLPGTAPKTAANPTTPVVK